MLQQYEKFMEWKNLKKTIQQREIMVEELTEKLQELPQLQEKLEQKTGEVFQSNKLLH